MRRLQVLQEVVEKPKTRGDCQEGGLNAVRPCRFMCCHYHLYADLVEQDPTANIHMMRRTCSLDVADDGESSLEEIGEMMGLTRERVRQIEEAALHKMQKSKRGRLGDFKLGN